MDMKILMFSPRPAAICTRSWTIAAAVIALLFAWPVTAWAEAQQCAPSAALSMPAVKNMPLLAFMKAVAAKAGMTVRHQGIGQMRISGDAFSGMGLAELLRETSQDSDFNAAVKGCTIVLSPRQQAAAVASTPPPLPPERDLTLARKLSPDLPLPAPAERQALVRQPPLPSTEFDLANLVFAFAEKSGRSVTMIGHRVPFPVRITGTLNLNAENLAATINKAAMGVMHVTVNDSSVILRYLSPGIATAHAAQDQFRTQGQFVVPPAQESTQ